MLQPGELIEHLTALTQEVKVRHYGKVQIAVRPGQKYQKIKVFQQIL